MIEIQNLVKSFQDKEILKNISLDIQDNETLVILGPSGQGKTVLIKSLNRLLEPDSGHILYDGQDIMKLKRKALTQFRKKMAFVFQNSALFDFLNVRENLSLYLTMHTKMPKKQIADKVNEALTFVGLNGGTEDKFPDEISGGMKKRVAIARAMIKQPEYIFYDEPTIGLDDNNATKVCKLVNMLKRKIDATSVIVTHDIRLMKDVADRVALLKNGQFVFIGKQDELSGDMLKYLYKGDDNEL